MLAFIDKDSPDRLVGALLKVMELSRKKITDGLHRKANGVWEKQKTINGKRRSFSSTDPSEVWKKLEDALSDAKTDKLELDSEKRHGPLFEIVADAYEEKIYKLKHGTVKSYLPAIRRARERFSGRRIGTIEPWEITDFLNDLSNMAHNTVSDQKTVLNGIFQEWVENRIWKGIRNTARMVKIPRGLRRGKRLPPTDAQIQIVKDHYLDPDALLAVTFLCTGERRGEGIGIQLKDIDFKNKTIEIKDAVEHIGNQPHTTSTKTPAGVRKIPLLSMLAEALEPLRCLPPDTYILSGTNKPLTASQYENRWVSFWRRFGMAHYNVRPIKRKKRGKEVIIYRKEWLSDVTAHQFRHEYVCMLCMAGYPEGETIQLVGHADTKMIHQVYLALKPQMVQDAGNRLNALLSEEPKK